MAAENRFGSEYDAVLHLFDRQVLDKEGLMVCKVDDVELSELEDGLTVTALLAGSPALLPRMGGPLGKVVHEFWGRMGDEQADRQLPYRIGLELVERLDSAVVLTVERHGVLVTAPGEPDPSAPVRRRLGELVDMPVVGLGGRRTGKVVDVRLDQEHRICSLLVGRSGSTLGYDRHEAQGPMLVRLAVLAVTGHPSEIRIDDVDIDWEHRVVTQR